MTIEEFIAARLLEDEQAAAAASGGSKARWVADEEEVFAVFGSLTDPDRCPDHPHGRPNQCDDDQVADAVDVTDQKTDARARHIARHDPVRSIGQAAAIRRVLEFGAGLVSTSQQIQFENEVLVPIASIWAEHPDYPKEWVA